MGIRDRYDYTEAMLHHSLWTRWLEQNGLQTDKRAEGTRDIICMDFGFGLRSYTEEKKHIKSLIKKCDDEVKKEYLKNIERKIDDNKNLYKKLTTADIRRMFYENGAPITYKHIDKDGVITEETITYKMLYRNPSKAKTGQCMFIREELYDAAREWLTMGIGARMPEKNAKIVELSAYAPLTTSAIEGVVSIPVKDVLILKDQDSFFRTVADVVEVEDYDVQLEEIDPVTNKKKTVLVKKKKCVVNRRETDVKNTLWDGMALIESSVLPEWCNGMALLRQHFFKACAFKTRIQDFFRDYCAKNDINYETYEIEDMYGVRHLARDIKMITTDNATKWKKFVDLIGGDLLSGYNYWCDHVKADGNIWGIVKTDHVSKLDNVQQMSYQMINTLPCSEEDIYKIAETSVKYVELLKKDNDEFEKFLRRNATAVNHYEMLADLYAWNHDFQNSKLWKYDKRSIINGYVAKLRKGKITVEGDNLTVCGNPYALLLYTVGENWENDPTLLPDEGVIQVYTKRFNDGEYLCGIRNPHNSSNNLGYFKNVRHELMDKYFDFSNNIMAINCIHTDIQDRMNGEDFDSDFNFVTNQPQMVEAAKIAYRDYPTVVNNIPESGLSYDNTMAEYARMDTAMQGAQKAIGGSSDSAQLAQSYMWTKVAAGEYDDEYIQLYHNVVILAVLAQVAIDGCKRVYSVNPNDEIKRIRAQKCMNRKKDFPRFIKYVRSVPYTKNGNERSSSDIKKDKERIKRRIDDSIICPMNWLQDCLDKVQGSSRSNIIDSYLFLVAKPPGKPKASQMSKIRKIIEEYDGYVKNFVSLYNEDNNEVDYNELKNRSEKVISEISGLRISSATIYRLIETSLGFEGRTNKDAVYKNSSKYTRKILNALYRTNKEKFMNCFIK